MNLHDATTRVRRAIEVLTPEFELELPTAFVKVSERIPGIFDVILTNDDYLAPIHDITVRQVLGAQIGTITHEIGPRASIGSFDDSWPGDVRENDGASKPLPRGRRRAR
jgi:hypothetical protein